jgi:hypothetical protein
MEAAMHKTGNEAGHEEKTIVLDLERKLLHVQNLLSEVYHSGVSEPDKDEYDQFAPYVMHGATAGEADDDKN